MYCSPQLYHIKPRRLNAPKQVPPIIGRTFRATVLRLANQGKGGGTCCHPPWQAEHGPVEVVRT